MVFRGADNIVFPADAPLTPLCAPGVHLLLPHRAPYLPLRQDSQTRQPAALQMLMDTVWLLQNYPGATGEIHNFSLNIIFLSVKYKDICKDFPHTHLSSPWYAQFI